MTKEDLNKIEKKLNIELLTEYKDIALNNPLSDKNKYQFVNTVILDDCDEIIDLNLKLRREGFQDQIWPDYYFIFGYGRQDGYYFINLKNNKEIIFCADSERKYNPKKIASLKANDNFKKFIRIIKLVQKSGEV